MNKKLKLTINDEIKVKHEGAFNDLSPDQVHTSAAANLPEEWQEEIAKLIGYSFENMDAVIDAVVEASIEKMSVPAGEQKEVKDFLKLYFESDPDILESLNEIFFQE